MIIFIQSEMVPPFDFIKERRAHDFWDEYAVGSKFYVSLD